MQTILLKTQSNLVIEHQHKSFHYRYLFSSTLKSLIIDQVQYYLLHENS